MNSGGDTRGSSERLPRLFHVLVALGGTHLVQESHLRKAQNTGHLELKVSSSLRTWKENRDVQSVRGAAAGPQDTEQHR